MSLRCLRLPVLVLAGLMGCSGEQTVPPPSDGADPHDVAMGTPGVPLPPLVDAVRQGHAEKTLDRLNAPLHVEEQPRQNRHDPSQTDTVRTLHYDGMEIGVYDVSASGKRLVTHITVSDDRYATAQDLHVGSTPDRVEKGVYTYELDKITPNILRITFDGDTASQLHWSFYVD